MTLQICSSSPNAKRQIAVAERAQLVDARLIERDVFADYALRAVRSYTASTSAGTTTTRRRRINGRHHLGLIQRPQRPGVALAVPARAEQDQRAGVADAASDCADGLRAGRERGHAPVDVPCAAEIDGEAPTVVVRHGRSLRSVGHIVGFKPRQHLFRADRISPRGFAAAAATNKHNAATLVSRAENDVVALIADSGVTVIRLISGIASGVSVKVGQQVGVDGADVDGAHVYLQPLIPEARIAAVCCDGLNYTHQSKDCNTNPRNNPTNGQCAVSELDGLADTLAKVAR